ALAAFPDCPHHERLAATRVAGAKDARQAGMIVLGKDIAPRIEFEAEFGDDTFRLRTEEAEREQHEIAIELEVAAGHFFHNHPGAIALPIEPHAVEFFYLAVFADEAFGVDAPIAHDAFFVRTRRAHDHRPVRPRHFRRATIGGHRQQFELMHGRRALAIRGAQAVRSGIAAAEDRDLLACGGD